MKVQNHTAVQQTPVDMEGAVGAKVRWLIGENDGAPNFAMRMFELEPGGETPRHHHPYEHEVYVLEGNGRVYEGDTEHEIAAGDCIYVVSDEIHQFRNTGDAPMKFLCMVPIMNKCTD